MFAPSSFQATRPANEAIVESRGGERFDVLFVGAGPASLSGAIRLAQLLREKKGGVSIAIVEKAEGVGHHTLSGAIIDPRVFKELFPDTQELPFSAPVKKEGVYFLTKKSAIRVPTPPLMRNHGNHIASLCEVVRWLAKRAEELGVTVFTGFPAKALLVDGKKVIGIRTAEKGLGRRGERLANFEDSVDIEASVTVLGEGTRGHLANAYMEWQRAQRPQTYTLGVKELWETRTSLKEVVHTLGWPLPSSVFGGSFMYPLKENLVSLGLVVGLGAQDASVDPHYLMQEMKTHPFFRKYLEGGERLEWGAKTIPEGGYYSIPGRLSGDGIILIGDSAGFVNVPSLKGIHYAMKSGMLAAETIAGAIGKNDFSSSALGKYDDSIKSSFITKDLWFTRNMRQAFGGGLYGGMLKAGMMFFMGGWWPKRSVIRDTGTIPRNAGTLPLIKPDGKLTFSKADSVHKSGNVTRDNIPRHLTVVEDLPAEVMDFYSRLCPAGVYERQGDRLVVNAPNCIDCMSTDVLAARWSPREGGSGPRYKRM